MSFDMAKYALVMLLAGFGIPVLAALNAQLGGRIASPPAATIVLFAVALAAAFVATTVTTGLSPLYQLSSQPIHLFTAGLFIAFYVLSITFVAPRFGVGNAIMCVLFGQMIAASAIDHFGLFGAMVKPLSPLRGGGVSLMALGLALFQWR
jgi:bacterial/archaeal transporter family-2 protein